MQANKAVDKILTDHEIRIAKLEELLASKAPISKKTTKNTTKSATLADHIVALRDAGFFATARTADDAHKKLASHYHCDLNRVAVALFRLASRKQLRKARAVVNGKDYQAYVW
jgi:hypothetical protein